MELTLKQAKDIVKNNECDGIISFCYFCPVLQHFKSPTNKNCKLKLIKLAKNYLNLETWKTWKTL